MQRNRVLSAFSGCRNLFCIRRKADLLVHSPRSAWCVAARGCSARSNEKETFHSAKEDMDVRITTPIQTPSSSSSCVSGNIDWDDDSLVEEIRRVLMSELPPINEGGKENNCSSSNGGSNSSSSIPLHILFRALGPTLQLRLQKSSFGALIKALRSKPAWFLVSEDGSKVGLSEAAWSCEEKQSSNNAENNNNNNNNSLNEASSLHGMMKSAPSKKASIASSKNYVVVRGSFASTPIDTSKPPLTSEEVEKWKLTRLLLPLALYFLLDREPVTLFPHGEKPRPLSPEVDAFEPLYVSKGLFPPAEVAAAFIHITPTFFVETRHVLAAMSPDVAECVERCVPKERVVDAFFKKYPMIFKLKVGRFQKTAVKLNLDFDFIKNYPGCGRADRGLRRHNQEYRATVGGVVSRPLPPAAGERGESENGRRRESHIDVKIFEILVRNLPRVPTKSSTSSSRHELEEKRCQPFSLVEWIDGFSAEDLDVLNSVPQQRVLTLLTRYSHIFQLMCRGEDANLFTEHVHLLKMLNNNSTVAQHTHKHKSGEGMFKKKDDSHVDDEKMDMVMTNKSPASSSPENNNDNNNNIIDSREKKREANFAAALRDDLIGLDDILSGGGGEESAIDALTETEGEEVQVADMNPLGDELNNDGDKDANVAQDENDEEYFLTEDDNAEEENNEEEKGKVMLEENQGTVNNMKNSISSPLSSFAEDDCDGPYIPSRYDIIYVRRLPKRIAPRSLSDFNASNTMEPELLRHIASFLNPPPSIRRNQRPGRMQATAAMKSAHMMTSIFAKESTAGPWRWVAIQRIYASLSKEQKRLLRPYKGLVHFMRLHGEVFELSTDFLHVIAHDPEGQIPPFVPTQVVFHSEDRVLLPQTFDDDETSKASLIADLERDKFESILGASQIPTNRRQLLLLDPLNPLLDHEILCEEVSFFMPDHPVSLHQLIARLPPMLKAALSVRHKNNFKMSKHLTVWMDNDRMMLQKSQLDVPEHVLAGGETLTAEDAIECVREVIPDEGVVVDHLHRMVPHPAKKALKRHFGNLYNALLGYPQYFYIDKVEGSRSNSVVFLVEHLQEE